MPFIQIHIHFVWSTKDRRPFLDSNRLRRQVWDHIWENARSKGIFIDAIGGYQDHCHCLISFGRDQTVSKILQMIKGESSYWINKNQLCKHRFEWQEEYFAASVSESMLERVRNYIRNQEDHHKLSTFEEEYDRWVWEALSKNEAQSG